MVRQSRKFIVVTVITVLVVIIILSLSSIPLNKPPQQDSVKGIAIGEVGMNASYQKIYYPSSVNKDAFFNISILFDCNITITSIYTTSLGFTVNNWTFSYNSYVKTGNGQGNFIGSVSRNIGVLNISIKSPTTSYNGEIVLHLVGKVPTNVIY
jgi:hypothetical protein